MGGAGGSSGGAGADAGTGTDSGADSSPGTIMATATGDPIGVPLKMTVAPSGTTVKSVDGVLELAFPAGAVAASTDITLTAISNEASLGIGTAWRLEPADTVLAAPATLVLTLPSETANIGDTNTLFLASQGADGFWQAAGAAAWSATADGGTVTSSTAVTHFGDWALASCVGLISDETLAMTAPAHLSAMRQCASAPTTGHVGGATLVTDSVAWSNAAEDGSTGLGTLTSSGATATLTPPRTSTMGSPITIVAADVGAVADPRALSLSIPLRYPIPVSGYVTWSVDGRRFIGSLGSSAQTFGGMTTIAGADLLMNASLNVAFPGGARGGAPATSVDAEVAGPLGQAAYKSTYSVPCANNMTMSLYTEVDVSKASTAELLMAGSIEGTVAITRGTKQCADGPEGDIALLPLSGVFILPWPGPR